MSIIETMARAIAIATRQSLAKSGYGGEDLPLPPEDVDLSKSYTLEARAALRAIKPEDVSARMSNAFNDAYNQAVRIGKGVDPITAGIAAAIAAGAEQ